MAESEWETIAALGDRSRRALFDYVRHAGRPVTREEAADALAMSRSLAAFHMDKLVDAGLLAARVESPPGQPRGRGRAPKVYEPAGDGLSVTIPARRYELMAEILADGIANAAAGSIASTGANGIANTRAGGRADTPIDLAHRSAYRRGVVAGADMRADGLIAALERLGFEPDGQNQRVTLHNCPFHALAATHTELVCGLNHALISGLVDGLGVQASPRLAPQPGRCCVELDRGEGGNRR